MEKAIEAKGICPVSNLPVTISVNYVERLDRKFDKQRFSCGFSCDRKNKCPIYHNANPIID